MNKGDQKRILILLTGLIILSLSLIFYLSWFVIFSSENVKKNVANRRSWIEESQILRGSIYDRNGELLAYSEGEPGRYSRKYTYPKLYSHIIGYADPTYGKSNLESTYDDYLLNKNKDKPLKNMKEWLGENNKIGNNLILTIDTNLQNKTRELLEETGLKCAAVVMSPKTGEIYSMVSLPDFDVSTIREEMPELNKRKDGVLENKAIQNTYTPGSTFKVVTSIAILENDINQSYIDQGTQEVDGKIFSNPIPDVANGKVDLKQALAESLNTYFVSKSVELGQNRLGDVAHKFMFDSFDSPIPFDLPLKTSRFDYRQVTDKKSGKVKGYEKEIFSNTDLAASSIGQGKIGATPLQMALVASTIANEGNMVAPFLVKEVESPKGTEVKVTEPTILSEVTTKEVADQMKDLMVNVVNNGIGSNAYIRGFQVAGKTGTAETETQSHAWFIGFAPSDEPKFAVAVLLAEADASGGSVAAPIARDLIIYANKYLNV